MPSMPIHKEVFYDKNYTTQIISLFYNEADGETQDNTILMLSILDSLNEFQKSINELDYKTKKLLLKNKIIQYGLRNICQNPEWR
jgi:hypothetical protein